MIGLLKAILYWIIILAIIILAIVGFNFYKKMKSKKQAQQAQIDAEKAKLDPTNPCMKDSSWFSSEDGLKAFDVYVTKDKLDKWDSFTMGMVDRMERQQDDLTEKDRIGVAFETIDPSDVNEIAPENYFYWLTESVNATLFNKNRTVRGNAIFMLRGMAEDLIKYKPDENDSGEKKEAYNQMKLGILNDEVCPLLNFLTNIDDRKIKNRMGLSPDDDSDLRLIHLYRTAIEIVGDESGRFSHAAIGAWKAILNRTVELAERFNNEADTLSEDEITQYFDDIEGGFHARKKEDITGE